jgi:exosortase A
MQPDQSLAFSAAPTAAGAGLVWRNALIRLGGLWLAFVLAFAHDWLGMAAQWWDSSTYNHILLIPAILGWLVWLRIGQLRQIEPQAWWPGLVTVAAALLVWTMGAFADFNLLRHAGAVALLPASLLLILGPRVAAGLAFPLCYMAFLVPFGEELVPLLQTITAALTISLVQLSGIPAIVDGVFIDTPAGLFEVAEACSGVKFLIAMVALGTLVANVCFRSWKRRGMFMALCIVAPILANGLRAWGTVYIAQYVGVEKAAGFDHIVYGWVFFALVIAGVLAISWRHFDRAVDDPMIDAAIINASPRLAAMAQRRMADPLALLLCGALVLGAQGWARAAQAIAAPLPQQIFLPAVPGWQRVDYAPTVWWEPRAGGADHRLLGRFADADGRTVDVFLALYRNQKEGSEATGFGEGALPPDSAWAWASTAKPINGAKADRLIANGRTQRVTHTYYRNGALLTGSALKLKLATIGDRLRLRAEPTVLLIISTEPRPGEDPDQTLAAFRQSTGPVGAWIDRIVALR